MHFSKQSRRVASFLIAFSMMTSSLTATTGFAKTSTEKLASKFAASVPNSVLTESEENLDEEIDEMECGHSGYVQPFMNPAYLQQAYVPKTLARAAKSFPSSFDMRNKGEVTDEIRNQIQMRRRTVLREIPSILGGILQVKLRAWYIPGMNLAAIPLWQMQRCPELDSNWMRLFLIRKATAILIMSMGNTF